jgi:arylsulfatase A-like enzyme
MKRIARLLTLALLLGWPALAQDKRPNIIFIMVDDLGNADLGYRGGQIKTPNLDALAQGGRAPGVVLRDATVHSIPGGPDDRALPDALRMQTGVIFPAHTYGLPTDERTLPQALKDAGYRTYMVGKWHLGHADRKYWPQNRGFDSFYGCLGEAVDYFKHDRGGSNRLATQRQVLERGRILHEPDRRGGSRVAPRAGRQAALLSLFRLLATHQPYQVPAQYLARYPDIQDKQRQTYAAMASCLDDEGGTHGGRAGQEGSTRTTR